MKNTIQEFVPFEHKNVDYINNSLVLARQQRQNSDEVSMMAAAVIYANLAEYLARNIFENIQHMFFLISFKSLNGVLFIKNPSHFKKKNPKMLGHLCEALSYYEFPDSSSFISLLKKFSENRTAIFHKLLSVSEDEIPKIDKQLSELHSMAEEILDKYNIITVGIGNSWYASANSLNQPIEPKKTPSKNSNWKKNNLAFYYYSLEKVAFLYLKMLKCES